MDEISQKLDRIEKKIDILVDNSTHVRSHVNWIDRISGFFLPGLSRALGLKLGTRKNLRLDAEPDRSA